MKSTPIIDNYDTALKALYENPLYSNIEGTETKRKIAILSKVLNCGYGVSFTIDSVTEEEEDEVTLSDLEEMYLEQIGYKKSFSL